MNVFTHQLTIGLKTCAYIKPTCQDQWRRLSETSPVQTQKQNSLKNPHSFPRKRKGVIVIKCARQSKDFRDAL
jgi:hypothetical protein